MKTRELYIEDYKSLCWYRKLKWLWYWYSWVVVRWIGHWIGRPWIWNGGRHTDGDPTVCPDCKRVFRVRHCVHTYSAVGEDVEGVEECPNCYAEL